MPPPEWLLVLALVGLVFLLTATRHALCLFVVLLWGVERWQVRRCASRRHRWQSSSRGGFVCRRCGASGD